MDRKKSSNQNQKNEKARRKKQLNTLLEQLEKKREKLNHLAEQEYIDSGDLSKIVFCEEQREFNRVSKDLANILAEIRKADDETKPE